MYNSASYNGLHSNPNLLHGLMSMHGGPSSSGVIEAATNNNGSSSGSYSGGYIGGGMGSTSSNAVGSMEPEPLAMVKVDYDMPSTAGDAGGGYGGWSTESVQGPNNGGVFAMWND